MVGEWITVGFIKFYYVTVLILSVLLLVAFSFRCLLTVPLFSHGDKILTGPGRVISDYVFELLAPQALGRDSPVNTARASEFFPVGPVPDKRQTAVLTYGWILFGLCLWVFVLPEAGRAH
jgi:hypothetical protein